MNQIFASLLALFAVSTLTICAPSGPTLNDLQAITCPSAKPFLCLPYGACCSGSQFCHSGLCESCFPMDIGETALLEWCREKGQYDVTLMKHMGCRLACQDVFNSSQLANNVASQFAHNEFGSVKILENSSPPTSSNQHDAFEDNRAHGEKVIILLSIITSLTSVGLVLSVSLNIYQARNSYKLKRTKTPAHSENSIKSNKIGLNNNLDGNPDPKSPESEEANTPLLKNKDRDDKQNEKLAVDIDTDDKDLAKKRVSRRDSLSSQLNFAGAQVRGAQSTFAIDEALRTNSVMEREHSKMSLRDVDIHSKEDRSRAIAKLNMSDVEFHRSQHCLQSQERHKHKLPHEKNKHSALDTNAFSIHSASENDVRSHSGDESPERREEKKF